MMSLRGMSVWTTMSDHRVCPVWIGYLLASPIRFFFQNPEKIVAPHVKSGMRVMDVGSAMGFFSLPLARLVGPSGRVICLDLQQKMLDSLLRRAQRTKLAARIETRVCGTESLGVADLAGRIDFALLFAVVHEVSDPPRLFSEIRDTLKPGGRILFAEPKGHVRKGKFLVSLSIAENAGLRKIDTPKIPWSHAALLESV